MSKDPFQILADELTLIRKDMDRMQRTSLDKDEAQALHQIVAEAVSDMRRATKETPQALQSALKADRDRMARNATQAATEAAERVLGDIREQLAQERQKLSQAAGEARREAWRWFGGFWVWLASIGAAGALIGALAVFWLQGRADAKAFGQYPSIYCRTAGGEFADQRDGSRYCIFMVSPPTQTTGA